MGVPWPVEPMIAHPVGAVPEGEQWSYEPKFDGFRCLACRRPKRQARLLSRRLRPLTSAFPDVVDALVSGLPAGTVVDGELVVMTSGRLDFEALQRRLVARRVERVAPATLLVFDLIAQRGKDLRGLAWHERRRRLEQLIEVSGTGLALVPTTREPVGAHAWMRVTTDGIEGVVAKRVDHGYVPALRTWAKIRAKTSSEAVVGGVIGSPARPTALILGRYDHAGRLRVIGRTFPLSRDARLELGGMLRLPSGPHPWPIVLPGGRFGLPGGEPVVHTPVDPTVVVEIEVDAAFEAGRYRHAVKFVRTRLDLDPEDIRAAR